MPILPREPDIYPDDLFSQPNIDCADDAHWWLLYTKLSHEKVLSRWLRAFAIPFYAPVIARRHRSSSGKVRTAYNPLFTGYLFMYGDISARLRAQTSRCVLRCFEVPREDPLKHDLGQIHRLIASGAPLTPEARIEKGNHVRIRSGPLKGIEGIVVNDPAPARIIIVVNFLKQGASLLAGDYLVEPIAQSVPTENERVEFRKAKKRQRIVENAPPCRIYPKLKPRETEDGNQASAIGSPVSPERVK